MYEDYKKYTIDHYCQDYEDIISTINGFSDEELEMVANNLPENYEYLEYAIKEQVEARIIQILYDNLIKDLSDKNFYECFEGDIIDYLTGEGLSYESCGYYINLDYYTDWFISILNNSDHIYDFEVNSELNKYELVNSLNQVFTNIKFYI
jgi:hypothetical protein